MRILMLSCLVLINCALHAAETKVLTNTTKKSEHKYKKLIENTTWVVPPNTLLAYFYTNGTSTAVTDQTVWTIGAFEKGYFFGDSYSAINGSPSSHMRLVGSITPFGDVYITFYATTGNLLDTDVVNGIGKFVHKNGKYFFVMQMNSAQSNLLGLSHWSYMVKVKKKDRYYNQLPGISMSVPMFIAQFGVD